VASARQFHEESMGSSCENVSDREAGPLDHPFRVFNGRWRRRHGAAFAIHGWQAAGCHWIDDLQHDFRSSRADAATLLALNRLHQRRPDRAANLITCAIEGHRQVGDLEQLAADFLVLSLCLDATADASGAADARQSAARIVKESLDLTRHHRGARLAAWLQRFGSARPLLMKNG
jgi:hypothetical protein